MSRLGGIASNRLRVDQVTGMLPPGAPHPASLDEVQRVFVDCAPFEERRDLILSAVRVYCRQIWSLSPISTIWLNGGFVTLKQWAEPVDADLVVLVPEEHLAPFRRPGTAQLMTHENVTIFTAGGEPKENRTLRPYGGLVDAYIVKDTPARRALWDATWSRVTDQDKQVVSGIQKGYVEVKRDGE